MVMCGSVYLGQRRCLPSSGPKNEASRVYDMRMPNSLLHTTLPVDSLDFSVSNLQDEYWNILLVLARSKGNSWICAYFRRMAWLFPYMKAFIFQL